MPTLAGFWYGADLAWRQRLGLYPSLEMTAQDAEDRIGDRRRLIDALIDAGLWRDGRKALDGTVPPDLDEKLILAVHRFLAAAPSRIMMVQIEDLVGQATMGLQAGERLSVTDLLWGLLIPSGNDAAMALARHVSGSAEAFVAAMNRRAQELGLSQTRFANPCRVGI